MRVVYGEVGRLSSAACSLPLTTFDHMTPITSRVEMQRNHRPDKSEPGEGQTAVPLCMLAALSVATFDLLLLARCIHSALQNSASIIAP
jgi:hypothetical protein